MFKQTIHFLITVVISFGFVSVMMPDQPLTVQFVGGVSIGVAFFFYGRSRAKGMVTPQQLKRDTKVAHTISSLLFLLEAELLVACLAVGLILFRKFKDRPLTGIGLALFSGAVIFLLAKRSKRN